MSEKTQGTVKWFSRVKGYGFIQPDGASEDVFVHYTAILGEGFRNLDQGQRVEFSIEDTPKGPQAAEVTKLDLEPEGEGDASQPEPLPEPDGGGEAPQPEPLPEPEGEGEASQPEPLPAE
jgi:CspA family cold shock protein